jgi:hypothetical protein
MRRHLYTLLKPCPAILLELDLTNDIKECILANRIYHVPKEIIVKDESKSKVQQVINNYNVMNNFIGQMDTMTKLNGYMEHKQLAIIPFDYSIEQRFSKAKANLLKGVGHFNYSREDIIEMIDDLTMIKDKLFEHFNIHIEQNKVRIYEGGHWKEYHKTHGLRKLVQIVQENIWDTYEVYLIRKMQEKDLNFSDRVQFRSYLQEYYMFLACIGNEPYVRDRPNNQILFSPDDDRYWEDVEYEDVNAHSITDEYMKHFNTWKTELSDRDKERTKRDLLDILQNNNKRNIAELNKVILALINVDATYKEKVLETFNCVRL